MIFQHLQHQSFPWADLDMENNMVLPAQVPLINECFYGARPAERSGEDIDIILARLRSVKAFERFHPSLLHQICLCGFYECLEKGITRKPTGALQGWSSLMITVCVCQAENKAVLSQCIVRETLAPAGTPSSLVRWTSKFQRLHIIR